MNGRAIVYKALSEAEALVDVEVMPNFGFDDPPRSPFIVLRWGSAPNRRAVKRQVRDLEVWVHVPTSISRDFDDVDAIMGKAIAILESLEQETSGGESVTCIRYTGTGPDLEDTGYNTITRNAGFEILAR